MFQPAVKRRIEREEKRHVRKVVSLLAQPLSTRNRIPAQITEVVKGDVAARVSMQAGDIQMVALITRESADELGLEPDQQVMALIKATDVMISTGEDIA
jgi:molybdate transport system regulatory protein